MTRLEAILKDIESLEGKEVTIFGQPTKLVINDERRFFPRVKDLLKNLEDYQVSETLSDKIINAFESDDDKTIDLIEGFNSYNWESNIDHDIQFYHVKRNEKDFIMLSVHRYGDVRGNYTGYAVLAMTVDEFYEVAFESLWVYDSIDIDGVTYSLSVYGFNDSIEVESAAGDSFSITVSPFEDNIIEAIKDHYAEAVAEGK
jgi:hypothetical protein